MAGAGSRRVSGAFVALALALAFLSVAPTPVGAAAPWRFTTRAETDSIGAGSIGPAVATCPEGFIPVGGGLSNVTGDGGAMDFEIVAAYRNGNSFQVNVHNYTSQSQQATVTVVCALESNVGSLRLVSGTQARDATTGMASRTTQCAADEKALLGGADWSLGAGATRRIDFQGPVFGVAWYGSGYSPVAGAELSVEVYCIPASALGDAHMLQEDTTYSAQNAAVTAQLTCAAGRRQGAGGVHAFPVAGGPAANEFMGNDWYSAPLVNEPAWKMTTAVQANVTLRRTLWCLPASSPTISFTQTPPTVTNSSAANFAYTISDPVGESIGGVTCELDGGGVGCAAGSATLSGLNAGNHTFSVTARNESYQSTTQTYQWTVDQTPPTLVTPVAPPQVTGPVRIVFDEPVTSLDGLTITEVGKTSPLAGSLTTASTGSGGMVALFTPAEPLVAGERYDVFIPATITDLAGNAIAEQTARVRTALAVENTSAVLTQLWDRDTNGAASGGGYLESSTSGSRVAWTVTTTSGQQAVLRGLKRPDGGNATIFVDGVAAKVVSFYRSSAAWQAQIFASAPLSAGTHSISVRADGTKPSASTGTWVMPDSLTVGGAVHQETSAVQRFRRVAAPSASGGSYDTVAHKTSGDNGGGPRFLLVFDGTGIKGYVTKTPQSGAADVYVDGVKKATVNLASGSVVYKALGFSVTGLRAGRHTLRVQPVGTASGSGSAVGLDRVVIS